MICEQERRCWPIFSYVLALLSTVLLPMYVQAQTPSSAPLIQSNNLSYIGSFKLPSGTFGSTYGFGYAGTGGIGTYAVTYNPSNNSLFIGGHPYEQRVAEIAIPQSLSGTPTTTVLQNLTDALEGKLNSINPSDPNQKVLGAAFVYGNQLYLGAFSFYDGGATQSKSQFVRPTNLSTKGQVQGPFSVGNKYPGWVDKYAALIPSEWQSSFGGSVFVGGSGGAINALQSWGPSVSVINPSTIGSANPAPATLVLGYPNGTPLASDSTGNSYWSQSDNIFGVAFPTGTRSILFFGKHGSGKYCYGPGTSDPSLAGKPADGGVDTYCYDPENGSKGTHNYPYRSQVWAYDANDLISVKNGQKEASQVTPYAVWELDSSFTDIQGVGYDPVTQRMFVSAVCEDTGCAPIIKVYQINNVTGSTPTPVPSVTISANPAAINSGGASTLSWTSTNTDSCSASGGWSGTKGISGSTSVSPLATTIYTLTCTGANGSVSQSTTVTVTSSPPSGAIAASPANISFTTIVGSVPAPQSVIVTIPNGTNFSTNDTSPFYDAPLCWSGAGRSCASGTQVPITPNPSFFKSATVGTYSSTLSISSTGYADIVVQVTLTITSGTSQPPSVTSPTAPSNLVLQ